MNYFYPLNLLVFGFLLTAVLGLVSSWVDRKVTARVQYRVGPPFLQPFIDIVKLLGKETMIPAGASRMVFLTAPVIGLSGVIVASAILWGNQLRPAAGFAGDWIVMLYLLTVPSISIILGGFASGNPLASIGASREMKLVLAYELPFVLAMLVPVLRSDSIRLGDILAYQVLNGATAGTLSGVLALVVAVLCMQAKLALVPFDAPEAETEIVHGPLIEYSGTGLAVYRLMKNMLLFSLPFFLITMFLGGFQIQGIEILWSVLKFVGLLALATVIRNTNPRVRIDQAVRFFWGPMAILGAISVALALLGL
jgi:NADH-quinone oxidoreductase subunit H